LKPGQVIAEFQTKDGVSITIRTLKRGDLDALLRFAAIISKEKATNPSLGIVSLDHRPTRREEKEFLGSIIKGVRERNVVSLAAFSGREIVGHADVWRRKPKDVRHTGVFGIIIRDGYRDVGIGERLMREVLNQSRRLGVWLVELTVFSFNDRAIHVYERMGFNRVGTVPHKIVRRGRHIDEIAMYADLRNR